jgi:putative ABC transport system permease protein
LLTSVAGALAPALRAERLQPLEALRPAETETRRLGWVRIAVGLAFLIPSILALAAPGTAFVAPGFFSFWIALALIGPLLVGPLGEACARLAAWKRPVETAVASRNLYRNNRRVASTAVTLCVGLSVLMGVGGMIQAFRVSLTNYVERSLGSDFILMPSSLILGSGNVGAGAGLDAALDGVAGIAVHTGMRSASAMAEKPDAGQRPALSKLPAGPVNVQVIGISAVDYPKVTSLDFVEGDQSSFASLAADEVIVNGILAGQAGLKRGDTLNITTPAGTKPYRVAAVANDFINIKITSVFMGKESFTREFGPSPELVTFMKLREGADPARTESELRALLADYPSQILYAGSSFKKMMLDMLMPALYLIYFFLFLFCVPAIVALVNNLVMSVMERTREFGIMRAVGTTKEQLAAVVMLESAIICGLSLILSVLGGSLFNRTLNVLLADSGFPMRYGFPAEGLAVCVVACVLIAIIGSQSPVRHVKGLKIIEALRYE